MMRIAISINDRNGLESQISHHFGRCRHYALIDMDGEDIQSLEIIDNPFHHQHQPGMVPGFIRQHDVDLMISGGMGRRAIDFFQEFNIQTLTGASGTVQDTIENYLLGKLKTAEPCHESQKHAHHDSHRKHDNG